MKKNRLEQSAPLVEISGDRLVTVMWNRGQFEEKFDCADKFEVGVKNSEVEGDCAPLARWLGRWKLWRIMYLQDG